MKNILLLLLAISTHTYADEEKEEAKTQLKFGVESTQRTMSVAAGAIDLYSFDLTSWSVHIEDPVWREIGYGVGFRKEEAYTYDGYYLDLYARLKYDVPRSPFYVHLSAGITTGVPSKEYDYFDGNDWVFLKQDTKVFGKKIFVTHPIMSIAIGIPIYKRFSLEPGVGVNFMDFGFKRYEPPVDEYREWSVPTFRIRLVYSY